MPVVRCASESDQVSMMCQVASGGSYGAPLDRRGGVETGRRHPVAMASFAFMLAAVAALGVVSVAVVDEGGAVELSQTGGAAVNSLHFINSLHPEEAAHAVTHDGAGSADSPSSLAASTDSIVGSTHDEQLASAKLAAQNRLDSASLPKSVQAESREELKLKQELDASVQSKENDALSLSSRNMKSILAEAAEANRAKLLKVKVTSADADSDDTSEEAALRKQLDTDARKRQANMLNKSEPDLRDVKGSHERMSVAATHLARKAGKQLSESDLEAELRNQLNSKVKNEESSMFKSAVNHWLGKNAKSAHSAHTAGSRGRSMHRLHQKAAAAHPATATNSLVLAEKMMKHELTISKHPGQDTTLSHSPLSKVRKQTGKSKQHGLQQLENAMIQSTLKKSRTDEPKMHKSHEMMHKLRTAAQDKQQSVKSSQPSYKVAMKKFATRLMHKEDSARHRYLNKGLKAGIVNKKALEAAIKRKVFAPPFLRSHPSFSFSFAPAFLLLVSSLPPLHIPSCTSSSSYSTLPSKPPILSPVFGFWLGGLTWSFTLDTLGGIEAFGGG